jgi:hydroxymethylglutaryl-CoA reductase
LIKGSHVNGYVLCPFATTEGALVASATRGATALTRAGGVQTRVVEQIQIRSPSFQLRSMQEVDCLISWFDDNFATLQKQVEGR